MSKVLTHSTKSYIKIFFVGILVGCICRLADYFPADTLWSFSSIQTLLGFWIITNTTIVLLSTSNICAGISSFLYMFGMTLSFYGLQAILGMFVPLFSGGFRFSLFVLFTLLSIPCAIAAYILYYWNREYFLFHIIFSSDRCFSCRSNRNFYLFFGASYISVSTANGCCRRDCFFPTFL